MASLEAEMLQFITEGLRHHDQTCPMPAQAILLNPGNYELFGWDDVKGIPVIADERVAPKRFRIQCDGSAFGIEEVVEEFVDARPPVEQPQVVPVPAGPIEPGEEPGRSSPF